MPLQFGPFELPNISERKTQFDWAQEEMVMGEKLKAR